MLSECRTTVQLLAICSAFNGIVAIGLPIQFVPIVLTMHVILHEPIGFSVWITLYHANSNLYLSLDTCFFDWMSICPSIVSQLVFNMCTTVEMQFVIAFI